MVKMHERRRSILSIVICRVTCRSKHYRKATAARTANEGEDGEGEGACGEHHLQLDEPVAAAVQLYVDVLLRVLHVLACKANDINHNN